MDTPAEAGEPLRLEALIGEAKPFGQRLFAQYLTDTDLSVMHKVSHCCRGWVQEASKLAATAISISGGRSPSELRQAWSEAEQRLLRNSACRANKLVVTLVPTCGVACQSRPRLSAAAGHVVTHLEVCYDESAASGEDVFCVCVAWLEDLDTLFPNLRGLSLVRVWGLLPDPARLPRLHELCVDLRTQLAQQAAGAGLTLRQRSSNVAPYTKQLTSFSVEQPGDVPMAWPVLFTPTTTLTHLEINGVIDDALVATLCTHATSVTHIECAGFDLSDQHQGAAWGVTHLCIENIGDRELACLPHSPGTLRVSSRYGELRLSITVRSAQGVSPRVQERMSTWAFDAPCYADVVICPTVMDSDVRAGMQAALVQLSGLLPAGTRVRVAEELPCGRRYEAMAAGIGAASGLVPHLRILCPAPSPPCDSGTVVSVLCRKAVPHVELPELQLTQSLAHLRWPQLRSLSVERPMRLSQLQFLPWPGERYELRISHILADGFKYTPRYLTDFARRVRKATFLVGVDGLTITAPTTNQAAALSQTFKVLRSARIVVMSAGYEYAADHLKLSITLRGWTLTEDVIKELSGLPSGFTLTFLDCEWVEGVRYDQLAAKVPSCWKEWCMYGTGVKQPTVEQILSICFGIAARDGQSSLWLHTQTEASEEDKEIVSAFVEMAVQRDMLLFLEVEWGCTPTA